MQELLALKTWPRVCPVSWCLSMVALHPRNSNDVLFVMLLDFWYIITQAWGLTGFYIGVIYLLQMHLAVTVAYLPWQPWANRTNPKGLFTLVRFVCKNTCDIASRYRLPYLPWQLGSFLSLLHHPRWPRQASSECRCRRHYHATFANVNTA